MILFRISINTLSNKLQYLKCIMAMVSLLNDTTEKIKIKHNNKNKIIQYYYMISVILCVYQDKVNVK